MSPTEIVDVLGKNCPYPLTIIKKTMEKLAVGSILKVLCDTPATVEDSIPRYCEKHGYNLESVWIEDKGYWEIYIQKT
ncbi:MAG: sulfurtransferase TusA family protein [Nitrospirae bacterium]|nr:sulfurtransferase TusA family protein [Nitrospirota bacterium]